MNDQKIAIVYDWIDKWGGVERVLLTLNKIFPKADFFTSYYNIKDAFWAKNLRIKTSFVQKFPDFLKKNRVLSFIFYPYAFESFDFSQYQIVISVTSSFSKGVITKPQTLHICYLLTPTRYLWLYPNLYLKNKFRKLISPYLEKIRKWDFLAAQRPDKIISISKVVADRCSKFYRRKSQVIYPPFDVDYWTNIKKKIALKKISKYKFIGSNFFLVVSRLEPYKKVDLVIKTFNQLSLPLIIIGKGTQSKTLRKSANKNIFFFEDLTDDELAYFYQNAMALIIPQEEDFGYTALESQFFGCPVIAYKKGGVLETVIENKTGVFFHKQSQQNLLTTIKKIHTISYKFKKMTKNFGQKNVLKFSQNIFTKSFIDIIQSQRKQIISYINIKHDI